MQNSEGKLSHVKLINLKKDTELKPLDDDKTRMSPFSFEVAILGIIVSTVSIVLIRKRKTK